MNASLFYVFRKKTKLCSTMGVMRRTVSSKLRVIIDKLQTDMNETFLFRSPTHSPISSNKLFMVKRVNQQSSIALAYSRVNHKADTKVSQLKFK